MTARESAASAAEAIHQLNYDTLPWDDFPGLEYPSDVYDVIGSLSRLAGMLPQALLQLSMWLTANRDARNIGHDEGLDAAGAVAGAVFELNLARSRCLDLQYAFDSAHAHLAHLRWDGPDGES